MVTRTARRPFRTLELLPGLYESPLIPQFGRIGFARLRCIWPAFTRNSHEAAQAFYLVVPRVLARQHEAQGNQRLVSDPGAEQIQSAVERRRVRDGRPFAQECRDGIPLRPAVFKKIVVDGLEWHPMAFAGRVLLLCVLALGITGATGKPPSLHLLVDQMRAASGAPYKHHIFSISHERIDGVDVVTRTDFSELKFTTHLCDATICTGTYFDGRRLYGVNINDTALPNAIETQRIIRAIRIVNSGAFLEPDFLQNGGRLNDLGSIRDNNINYRAIGVNGVDAQPLVVLVDPGTHLVHAVRDWKGQVSFEDGDYRQAGTLMLPFKVYRHGTLSQAYDSREVSAEPYEPPHGLTVRYNGEPQPIPIVSGANTPIVPCMVARIVVRCLIDTGNSGLSISKELAEQLRLTPIGEFEVSGLGKYATEIVRTGPLSVGAAEFPAADYVVLHDIHQYGYDAVLGSDVLANSVVTIDYAAHTVFFNDRASGVPASSVAVAFLNFVPVVPVQLGNTVALLAVDTGDESTINLSYDYYLRHTDLFLATEARSVDGVGGSSEELMGEIAHVQLGEYRVEAQRIGTTRTLHATGEGHLGAGFLSHFRVVLDYAHARVGLTPRTGDTAIR